MKSAASVTTPEEVSREAEKEVKQAIRQLNQPGQTGYVITTPARARYDQDGNQAHLLDERPDLNVQPMMVKGKDGKTRRVEGGVIKMYQGRGVTFNEDWANWVRDYFGYKVERVDEQGQVSGYSIEESRVLDAYERNRG